MTNPNEQHPALAEPTGQTKRQQDVARALKALKAKGDSAYLKKPMI